MSTNRFKKSQKQLQILQNYYIQYPKWTNQTIHQIEKHSKLPRDKIYKWYWDQNKKLMPKNKQDQPIEVEIQCKGNLLVSSTNQILSCTGVHIDKQNWNLYGDRLGLKLLCYIGCSYLIQFQLLQSDLYYEIKQNNILLLLKIKASQCIILSFIQLRILQNDFQKKIMNQENIIIEFNQNITQDQKKNLRIIKKEYSFLQVWQHFYPCPQFIIVKFQIIIIIFIIVLQGFEKYKYDLGFKIKSLIYGQELFLQPSFVEYNFKPNITQDLLRTFREIDELMPIGFTYQYVQSVCECLNIPSISEQQNKSITPKQFDDFFKNIDTQQVIQAIKQVQNKELQSQMRMLK